MKKTLYLTLISLFILSMTSCSHRIYNIKTLQGYYDIRMDDKSELEIKSKVRIFQSTDEVKGEYTVISHNSYSPFCLPILMSEKKVITKKLYEKAAKQAYKVGGNGVIMTSVNTYQVIALHHWDSDNESIKDYVNLILDTTLMNKFNNGIVAQLTPREVTRHINDLKHEIEFNIKSATTLDEILVIEKKLDALQTYNNKCSNFDKSLDKYILLYRKYLIIKAKVISLKHKQILTTSLMDKFSDGRISELTSKQIKHYSKEFLEEINFNIQNAKTSEDAALIGKK